MSGTGVCNTSTLQMNFTGFLKFTFFFSANGFPNRRYDQFQQTPKKIAKTRLITPKG